MKKKVITLKRYKEIIKPGEQLSYSAESLIKPIRLPPENGIFFAVHGPEALVANQYNGTVYVCRKDGRDLKPLNFDVYSIQATADPDIIEITILPKQSYHWTDDVPDIMKDSAPEWVKEKIEKVRKDNSQQN